MDTGSAEKVGWRNYLLVLVFMAALVYERLGLRLLRTAWINLDLIWSVALTCTAVLTVAI